jgi:hypothetical protein
MERLAKAIRNWIGWLTGLDFGGICQELRGAKGRSISLFPEHRRAHPAGLPIEIGVIAGPGVDLGVADPAFEAAGALVLVFFPRRGVIHPAARAGEDFGRPDAVGHFRYPRMRFHFFSLFRLVYPTGPFEDLNPIAGNWLIHAISAPSPDGRQSTAENKKPRPKPGPFDPP